jgi:hypothetical protein
MSLLNFDARQVQPDMGYDVLPPDWYPVVMDESELKPTQNGDGMVLNVRFNVIAGQYVNRKIFGRINLSNPNPQAQEIGQKQLSAIAHCVGVLVVQDSQQLHNIPLLVKVKIRKADGQYEDNNEIIAYRNISDVPAGMAQAQPQFQQQTNPFQQQPQFQQPQFQQAPAAQAAQPQFQQQTNPFGAPAQFGNIPPPPPPPPQPQFQVPPQPQFQQPQQPQFQQAPGNVAPQPQQPQFQQAPAAQAAQPQFQAPPPADSGGSTRQPGGAGRPGVGVFTAPSTATTQAAQAAAPADAAQAQHPAQSALPPWMQQNKG